MKISTLGLAILTTAFGGVASGYVEVARESHVATTVSQAKTAEEIFTRYVEALGGEAKYKTLTSRYVEGVVENVKTKTKSRLTAWQKAPNQIRIELETPALNTFDQGFDGTVGWMREVRNARLLEGDELAVLKETGDFYGEIEWKRRYAKMEVLPDSPFDGKTANVVKATNQAGKVQTLYFDAATGLLAGYQEEGAVVTTTKKPTITIVGDYKDFDGVKYATRYVQRSGDSELVTTYRKVVMNPSMTMDFSVPPDVKATIEKNTKEKSQKPAGTTGAAPEKTNPEKK